MLNLTVKPSSLYALSNTSLHYLSPQSLEIMEFLANANKRKCALKRVQQSWSIIMQFPKH